MFRAAILTVLGLASGMTAASAQSWSVEVGAGYGPRPNYLYENPPVVYAPAPPPAIYAPAPPVIYVPAPAQAVRSAVSPDDVFDALERAGYREFSPMAFREGVYKLNAVNRRGDLVALEVSALDGQVEREFILQRRHSARVLSPAPREAPLPRLAPESSGASGDPLVVY